MILGLGSDIVEIERIRKLIRRFGDTFLHRLFTKEEIRYCQKHKDPAPRFAGRFAAKEALAKALGKGFGKEVGWHDLIILPDHSGRPTVTLSPALSKTFHHPHLLITISHCKTFATAYALWVKEVK